MPRGGLIQRLAFRYFAEDRKRVACISRVGNFNRYKQGGYRVQRHRDVSAARDLQHRGGTTAIAEAEVATEATAE